MESTKEEIAHHEAGHAVIGLALGLTFETITIIPDEDVLGSVRGPSVMGYSFRTKRERRSIGRDCIISYYAGLEAQRNYNSAADDVNSLQDDEDAFEISRMYEVLPKKASYIGDDVHLRYLRRLRAEARKLVKREWPKIACLAEELLAGSGVMTRAEVETLFAARFSE